MKIYDDFFKKNVEFLPVKSLFEVSSHQNKKTGTPGPYPLLTIGKDGNGYPLSMYPRVKNPLGTDLGTSLYPRVRVQVRVAFDIHGYLQNG
jgi:hypothetical protein